MLEMRQMIEQACLPDRCEVSCTDGANLTIRLGQGQSLDEGVTLSGVPCKASTVAVTWSTWWDSCTRCVPATRRHSRRLPEAPAAPRSAHAGRAHIFRHQAVEPEQDHRHQDGDQQQ